MDSPCILGFDPTLKGDSVHRSTLPFLPDTQLDGEQLIVGQDGEVFWVQSDSLIRKFSFPGELVVRAIFANFSFNEVPSESSTNHGRAVVIVLSTVIYVYFLNGASHTVSIPFVATNAAACERGVVIERDLSTSASSARSGPNLGMLPKFFIMIDPILELGMVVSSSTSAILPNEELLYFSDSSSSSVCVTLDTIEQALNIYHIRYISRHSKPGSNKRRSSSRRKSSSIYHSLQHADDAMSLSNPDSGAASDASSAASFSSSFEQRLDRMGLGVFGFEGIDGGYDNPMKMLDPSNMRKDVILTNIESYPVDCNIQKISAFNLSSQEREAIVIILPHEQLVTILLIERSTGPVGISRCRESWQIPARSAVKVSTKSDQFKDSIFAVLDLDGRSIYLFNPFLKLKSHPINLPEKWGFATEFNSSSYCTLSLNTQNNGSKVLELIIAPYSDLVIRCFTVLQVLLDSITVEYLKFQWAAALSLAEESRRDEWNAFIVVIIGCFLDDIEIHGQSACKFTEELQQALFLNQNSLQFDFVSARPFLILCLHILREEFKLDTSMFRYVSLLGDFLAQLVIWSGWPESWPSYYLKGSSEGFDLTPRFNKVEYPLLAHPPNIFKTLHSYLSPPLVPYTRLSELSNQKVLQVDQAVTPHTFHMLEIFQSMSSSDSKQSEIVQMMSRYQITNSDLNRFPIGIAIILREILSQSSNITATSLTFEPKILDLIGRTDLKWFYSKDQVSALPHFTSKDSTRDVKLIVQGLLENDGGSSGTATASLEGHSETDKLAICKLIFNEDRRFYEVSKLLQSSKIQTATLIQSPEWNEHELMQMQQNLLKAVALRTFSIPLGRGALFFSARECLSTEKFPIPRLNFSVIVKPTSVTLSPQKPLYSEEHMSWGYFHNGVSAGTSIAKSSAKITGSWIMFNRPPSLNAQHAGFLLGLGLNGHLKRLEEWHIYNYLGPKHAHTSIALLIGMAASHLGSMNNKLTKVLSVHVVALLPVGSTDLNVSILVQTAGIIGIGLLYFETQHRRMSEVLLAELNGSSHSQLSHENSEERLQNESYYLAAGMSLGLINLGKGNDLKGLTDVNMIEQLLGLVGALRDIQTPDSSDRATPGAIIALAFIYMKTHNESAVRKLEMPDSEQLFSYIRPDLLLLRTLAKHIILWNDIGSSKQWIEENIPKVLLNMWSIETIRSLDSDQLPYFNILAGLCLAMGLKFSSLADTTAKTTLLFYLDNLIRLTELPVSNHDQSITRDTLTNILGLVSLALATVLVGTGDLDLFRRLRRIYSRTKKDVPFGCYMSNQMAMGILFLGAGQCSFKHSNLATASLIIAFYPLFPTSLKDNNAHLQALRHFWILAAENRCLVTRDVETLKFCSQDVTIQLKGGEILRKRAPCLLPELDSISVISTILRDGVVYISLNFENDPEQLALFKKKFQTIFISQKKATGANPEKGHLFDATIRALDNDLMNERSLTNNLLKLYPLSELDRLEQASVLSVPNNLKSCNVLISSSTDFKLALENMASSPRNADDLWNVKLLFAFSETREGQGSEYLSNAFVDKLKILLWNFRSQLG